MGELQWIKLYVDIFSTSRKIKKIERLKNGDTYLVIWFKLLCMAGMINNGGVIYITPEIPFEIEDLADEVGRPASVVQKALETFERYEMILRDDAGFIKIASWKVYQGVDKMDRVREQTRERVAKHRQKKGVTSNVTGNADVTGCNAIEREVRSKNKELYTLSTERVAGQSVTCNVISEENRATLHANGVPDDYIDFAATKIRDRGYRYDDICGAILSWWNEDKHRRCSPPKEEEGENENFVSEDFFNAALRKSYGEDYDKIFEGGGNGNAGTE